VTSLGNNLSNPSLKYTFQCRYPPIPLLPPS
jgi:hypothetical protein